MPPSHGQKWVTRAPNCSGFVNRLFFPETSESDPGHAFGKRSLGWEGKLAQDPICLLTSSWPVTARPPRKAPLPKNTLHCSSEGPEKSHPFPHCGSPSGFTMISRSESLSCPTPLSPEAHTESHRPQEASSDSLASPRTPISELLEPGTWLPREPGAAP